MEIIIEKVVAFYDNTFYRRSPVLKIWASVVMCVPVTWLFLSDTVVASFKGGNSFLLSFLAFCIFMKLNIYLKNFFPDRSGYSILTQKKLFIRWHI